MANRSFSEGFLRPKKDGKDSLSFQDKAKIIPSNIKSGVSIKVDGVTVNGSVAERKYATGTTTTIGNGNVSVTGVGFSPSIVVVVVTQGNYKYRLVYHGTSSFSGTTYFGDTGWVFRSVGMMGHGTDVSGSANGYQSTSPFNSATPDWSITADGFTSPTVPVGAGTSAQWWAFQ